MSIELPVLNWFEEPIKKSVSSVFHGLNDFVDSLDLFNRYRSLHLEILRPQVRTVKILGMQQPMDLERLYYPTEVSTDIRRRIYNPEWAAIDGSEKKQAKPKVRAVELGTKFVEAHPRTVILGGPGAGKTTFLKYLALAYSDKKVFDKTGLTESYLPVYLHLPLLPREGMDVLQAAAMQVKTKTDHRAVSFYQRLFETGNIVLLLDSLDEVASENREDVVRAISKFSATYPKARIIISCRTADYQQVFEGFDEVEVARLSPEAVKSIVKEWFFNDQSRADKLISMLGSDPAVAALTETPLLLSLLCIQYQ